MKTPTLLGVLAISAFLSTSAIAQQEMKMAWEAKPDHSIKYFGIDTANGRYTYAAGTDHITVYNTSTGQPIWSKKFAESSPKLKSIYHIEPMWHKECFYITEKISEYKFITALMDMKTGNIVWTKEDDNTQFYKDVIDIPEKSAIALCWDNTLIFIDAATGKTLSRVKGFHGSIYSYISGSDGNLVLLLTVGLVIKVDPANGTIVWETPVSGRAVYKALTREKLSRIVEKDGMILVDFAGLQYLDFATGKPLRTLYWNPYPPVIKKPIQDRKFYVYGAVAYPMEVGEYLYVLDVGDRDSQFLKKYKRKTGELVWSSPEIQNARAIPAMGIAGKLMVLQVGGTIETYEQYTMQASNGFYEAMGGLGFDQAKPFNMQAFDTETGKLVWATPPFKDITNSFMDGQEVFVSSDDNLFKMDAQTGKILYQVSLKNDNIGRAIRIEHFGTDKIAVMGDKGVSTHNRADGSLVKSASALKNLKPVINNNTAIRDGKILMANTDGDIAVFNLAAGQSFHDKEKEDAKLFMSKDFSTLVVFKGSKIKCLSAQQ